MPFVLVGLGLSAAVMLLFGGTEIDRGLLLLAAQLDAPLLKNAAGFIEALAQPLPLLIVGGAGLVWLLASRRWVEALLLAGITLSGRVAADLLQVWTWSVRPQLEERVLPSQGGAFPNGAAANATIALLALAFLLTRTRPARPLVLGAAATFCLAIGFSQMLRGETWPSDVIGGWAFGLLWTLLPLRLAGHDVTDGTARPLRHSLRQGDSMMENRRTETARETDDSELIDRMENGPDFSGASGGNLQRDIGSRAEMQHGEVGEEGVTRVRDQDKSEGANLPRFNEK